MSKDKKAITKKMVSNRLRNKINQSKNINIPNNISKLNDIQKFKFCQKILAHNNFELNNLSYQDALKNDMRSFILYYISLSKTNNLFIFSFFLNTDYNSRILKIYLFFFIMIINLAINALFFDDATMHVIYKEKGKFNFIYQIPKIIYSCLISAVLAKIFSFLSLTEKAILSLKDEKNLFILNKKEKDVKKNINRRIIIFYFFSFFLLLFFWYYISCFCAVYKNTQIHLIKDFIMSFITSFIYPFFIYILPGIFRISALNSTKKETMYKFSKFLQSLC